MIFSFLIILFVIALVGLSAGFLSKPNKSDYYLAGKSLSPWIVGLSAMATNNSGYMFIGLIGFTYLVGLPSIWLMVGWILGDFLISRIVHKKINEAVTKNSNVTYASVVGAWSEQGQFITKFIEEYVHSNKNINLQGILLTMYDSRNKISEMVSSDVKNHFGDKVFKTIIPRNVRISEAPSFGQPVLMYDIKCPGSQAYAALAGEIINQE